MQFYEDLTVMKRKIYYELHFKTSRKPATFGCKHDSRHEELAVKI